VLVADEMPKLAQVFGGLFQREMIKLDVEEDSELSKAIKELETEAGQEGQWKRSPGS